MFIQDEGDVIHPMLESAGLSFQPLSKGSGLHSKV